MTQLMNNGTIDITLIFDCDSFSNRLIKNSSLTIKEINSQFVYLTFQSERSQQTIKYPLTQFKQLLIDVSNQYQFKAKIHINQSNGDKLLSIKLGSMKSDNSFKSKGYNYYSSEQLFCQINNQDNIGSVFKNTPVLISSDHLPTIDSSKILTLKIYFDLIHKPESKLDSYKKSYLFIPTILNYSITRNNQLAFKTRTLGNPIISLIIVVFIITMVSLVLIDCAKDHPPQVPVYQQGLVCILAIIVVSGIIVFTIHNYLYRLTI